MLKIRVPATSANLGPGFDCLGLALDLWNEMTFEAADEVIYEVTGEDAHKLNNYPKNLLTNSFIQVYDFCGKKFTGIRVKSHNNILLSSGIGSSAAAIVSGLFAANEMLGCPLGTYGLLRIASEIEGHPDNVAPALLGGLVIAVMQQHEIVWRKYEIPELSIVVVKPEMEWTTQVGRAILPATYSRSDAIFNIARTPLVIDALRNGDLDLLQKVMDDKIHQPYRLEQISAGKIAYQTAREFGAVALSGAGPALICFVKPDIAETAMTSMMAAITGQGIQARGLITRPTSQGIYRVD
jgi:homoserine kinase